MDIQKIFAKIMSPETYTERGVFIALGIYCIDRALFVFSSNYNIYLRFLLAIFSITIGLVVLAKFGKKFKGDVLRQGLVGLGLWLIADGLYQILLPSFGQLVLLFLTKGLSILKLALSFGAGIVIMIGVKAKGRVKNEMGLFLLGLYLLLIIVFQMMTIFGIGGYYIYMFFKIVFPLLLFVSGVLLILRHSDEIIVRDNI